jgi:hypothetical protein
MWSVVTRVAEDGRARARRDRLDASPGVDARSSSKNGGSWM